MNCIIISAAEIKRGIMTAAEIELYADECENGIRKVVFACGLCLKSVLLQV